MVEKQKRAEKKKKPVCIVKNMLPLHCLQVFCLSHPKFLYKGVRSQFRYGPVLPFNLRFVYQVDQDDCRPAGVLLYHRRGTFAGRYQETSKHRAPKPSSGLATGGISKPSVWTLRQYHQLVGFAAGNGGMKEGLLTQTCPTYLQALIASDDVDYRLFPFVDLSSSKHWQSKKAQQLWTSSAFVPLGQCLLRYRRHDSP